MRWMCPLRAPCFPRSLAVVVPTRLTHSCSHRPFTGIERLAAVTGGEIASTFDKPELVRLGECALIDEIMVGEDKLIRFSGCKSGTACTIVLRGASSHLLGR
jgi:chaperonin GroEL (HSP60 family)